MAHPYAKYHEDKVSRSRVKHIMKSGGAAQHDDRAADKKLFKELIAQHEAGETKVPGSKKPGRYARGGKVKGHRTNIAIVVPQKSPPTAPGPQAGAAGSPPMAAPAPPMPMPPPGAGPGGPGGPPMMPPMRARGGKVMAGEATAGNIKKWSNRASQNSYARGGRLPTAGAETGVGRLQKVKK